MTIDIVMPLYGGLEQFQAAVRSVQAQTSPDWRLVVIDDHMPDPAPSAWLATVDDPRIEFFRNDQNLGVNGNFSRSLREVQSSHFVLMGCDDVMLPRYVERMARYIAAHPHVAYIQCDVQVIDDLGDRVSPIADRVKEFYRPSIDAEVTMSGEELAVSLLRGNWTYFPSICWQTDAVRAHGFRTGLEIVLDLDLQLAIVGEGGALLVVPDLLFAYRRHSLSYSYRTATDGTRFLEERALFENAAETMAAKGWNHAARVARLHLSSRLNAATRIPAAVTSDRKSLGLLLSHTFGPSRARG
ncbi:glycosyltransferase family 2 protein [Leifsonia sp. NPDC058230]|uniref:glycosyltransferase family 2 protein n=1 Tax=Leifsonia sp. NPDC058230 TaxID=3346391 RepID=UPI0036DB847C